MATNEIDILMDLDPLEMTKEDIDGIIAYHRNNRAREGADGKMTKAKGAAPKVQMDLTSLIQGMTKKEPSGEAPKPQTSGIRRV